MGNELLTTKDVAERLGVTVNRVQAMIRADRLPAQRLGRDFVIQESDLALVSERKAGRPKKEGAANDVQSEAKGQTSKGKRQRAEPLTLPKVSSKSPPAVTAKAAKKAKR
jgi:excisionase family DNA binding protein